jgi:hypothetical protein
MPTQQVTSNNYYIYNTPQAMISLILISKQNSLQKGEKTKRKKEKKAHLCLCFGDWTASASLVSQLSKQSKKNSSIHYHHLLQNPKATYFAVLIITITLTTSSRTIFFFFFFFFSSS